MSLRGSALARCRASDTVGSRMDAYVDRLYPAPALRVSLAGLYHNHHLPARASGSDHYVYGNFIASIDGRITEALPGAHRRARPLATRHPHYWRLYLELAAQDDAVIVSGRRWRELHAETDGPIDCVPDLVDSEWKAWRPA